MASSAVTRYAQRMAGFAWRMAFALGLAVAGAAAVLLLSANPQSALIALVAGCAAAVAAGTFDSAPSPDAASPIAAGASLDDVLDGIEQPIMLVRTGKVVRANRAARALLGDHVLGEDVRTAIRHPAAAPLLAEDHAGRASADLAGLGGIDNRWEMHVAPTDDGARVVHLIDRTGSYAAERMRVDFVANASHELRTPLASILGYVETLGEEAGDDPAIRTRFLKIMMDEARRMQRLVDDLISLSRIEAEKYRVPDRLVDLAALARTVHEELADAHGARGQDIEVAIGGALPPVAGDAAQLSQVLHNLIGNAMKYGRAGTPIRVALEQHASGVRLTVTDQGDGIAAEHLPRLTERFYRADAGRSRALGGTGLGLAIVKHIVERHRGRLDISSQVGVGTRVTAILPGQAVTKR